MDTSTWSLSDKELFCKLNLSVCPRLVREQERIAFELVQIFKTGTKDVCADWEKVKKYEIQAHAPLDIKFRKHAVHTKHIYEGWGWLHCLRLTAVRLERLLKLFDKSFLKTWFAFGGLLYLGELFVEAGVIIHNLRLPRESYEEDLSTGQLYLQRLKKTFAKGQRRNRIINAAVWFGINLVAMIITGGMWPVYINLIGFAFDLGHEFYKGYKEYKATKDFQRKIDSQADATSQTLEILRATPQPDENVKAQIKEYVQELESFKLIDEQLKRERRKILKERAVLVFSAALIIVGMVLFFFPPSTIAGATIIGASLALAGGLIGGLGKRIYNKITECIATYRQQKTLSPETFEDDEPEVIGTYQRSFSPIIKNASPPKRSEELSSPTCIRSSEPIDIINPNKRKRQWRYHETPSSFWSSGRNPNNNNDEVFNFSDKENVVHSKYKSI